MIKKALKLIIIMLFLLIFVIIGSVVIGIPYLGKIQTKPERALEIQDIEGNHLSNFDLFIYRCTYPGSQFDTVFFYPDMQKAQVSINKETKIGWKKFGYIPLAPDFIISHNPEPYWIACVSKKGFSDRRWSLSEGQGNPVIIKLIKSEVVGNDYCDPNPSEKCNTPCNSYEYFIYENSRFQGGSCE